MFTFPSRAKLWKFLALPIVFLSPIADAASCPSCIDGGTVEVSYRAMSVMKNGSLSVGMGGRWAKSVAGTSIPMMRMTPWDKVEVSKDGITTGTVMVTSDMITTTCEGNLYVQIEAPQCYGRVEMRSRRVAPDSGWSPWERKKVHSLWVAFYGEASVFSETYDLEVRFVKDEAWDDASFPTVDKTPGGAESGGSSAKLPAGQQATAPENPNDPPDLVDAASFYSQIDLGPGVSGRNAGSLRVSGPIAGATASLGNLSVLDPEIEAAMDVVEQTPNQVRQVFTSLRLIDVQTVSGDLVYSGRIADFFPARGRD